MENASMDMSVTPGELPTSVNDRLGRGSLSRASRVSRTGLKLDPRTSWEHWIAVGIRLSAHADASSWWLGDWLVFGERHYGSRYSTAIASTGLEYKTLRNYAVVARRFALSRRRDMLSFAHHAELCALDDAEQERWLDLARANTWSRSELRRQLRSATQGQAAERPHPLRISVDAARIDRWRRAAELCRCDLTLWVAQTLDDAAREMDAGCDPTPVPRSAG